MVDCPYSIQLQQPIAKIFIDQYNILFIEQFNYSGIASICLFTFKDLLISSVQQTNYSNKITSKTNYFK